MWEIRKFVADPRDLFAVSLNSAGTLQLRRVCAILSGYWRQL